MAMRMFNERVREILEAIKPFGGSGEYFATIKFVLVRYLRFQEEGHKGSHLALKRHGPWIGTNPNSRMSPNSVWGDGSRTGMLYKAGKHRQHKGLLQGSEWKRVLNDVFWWHRDDFATQQKLWNLAISSKGTDPATMPPGPRDPNSMRGVRY